MKIYGAEFNVIAAAARAAELPRPDRLRCGTRRPYYSLSLKAGIPAFLDALFALAPAAEVRTARGRWRGRAEWAAHRRAEAVQAAYEAGGLAEAAAWLRQVEGA